MWLRGFSFNFTSVWPPKSFCLSLEEIPTVVMISQIHEGSVNQSCRRLQNSRFFFSKLVKKSVKRCVRVLRARSARVSHVSPQSRSLFSVSFQTFCLTARAYLNTQKCGLFCSLIVSVCFCSAHWFNQYRIWVISKETKTMRLPDQDPILNHLHWMMLLMDKLLEVRAALPVP